MHKNKHLTRFALALCMLLALRAIPQVTVSNYSTVIPGAARLDEYLPLLQKKRVAVVTNATGLVNGSSIVDTLLRCGVNVVRIFGPEHGFRGIKDAGEQVKNNRDPKTGLPVISLYGNNKKPTREQLRHVD